MDHIVLGLLGGLIGATYLCIFFAALRSKSWLGMFLFLGLVVLNVLPSRLSHSLLPDPTAILDSWGLPASADLSGPGILALMLSMIGGLVLGYFTGLLKLLSQAIDRLSAALGTLFRRPENPTD